MGSKVEPPFSMSTPAYSPYHNLTIAAWSIDQIQKDVGAMMEELLVKTLPPSSKEEGKETKDDKKA